MLSTSLINDLLYKVNLLDYDFTLESKDETGDFLRVNFANLEYLKLKSGILANKHLSTAVTDIGPTLMTLTIKGNYKGFNMYYKVKIESTGDVGVKISLGTKRIDYVTSEGDIKHFISFYMMDEYKKMFEIVV